MKVCHQLVQVIWATDQVSLLQVSILEGRSRTAVLRLFPPMGALTTAIRTVLSGPVSSLPHQRCSAGTGLWILLHEGVTSTLQMPLRLPATSLAFALASKMRSRDLGISLAVGSLATTIRTILFGAMAFEPHQERSAQAHISAQASWP